MATKTKTKTKTKGPKCGHDVCRQNHADTGSTACVDNCAACGDDYTVSGPASRSLSRPGFCVDCVSTGYADELYGEAHDEP